MICTVPDRTSDFVGKDAWAESSRIRKPGGLLYIRVAGSLRFMVMVTLQFVSDRSFYSSRPAYMHAS